MDSKFFIFLAFASLAQGSFVPTTRVSYGRSDEESALLDEITIYQVATGDVFDDVGKAIFDVLSDPKANADGDSTKLYDALVGLETAVDLSLSAILLVSGDSCSAVEETRTKSYNYLEDAATRTVAAYKLALQPGSYSANQAAIEASEAAVTEDFLGVSASFYETVHTCLNTTDAEMQVAFERFQSGSYTVIRRTASAIFNAMKLRASTDEANYRDRAFTSAILDLEEKTARGFVEEVEFRFILLKTYIVKSYPDQSGIPLELFLIQHAEAVAFKRFQEGSDIILRVVVQLLNQIALGFNDDGGIERTQNDVASSETADLWNAGDAANFAAIMTVNPSVHPDLAEVRESVFNSNIKTVDAFFGVLDMAAATDGNYTQVIETINALRSKIVALGAESVQPYFSLLRKNKIYTAEEEAILADLQEITRDGAVAGGLSYSDAMEVVATANNRGTVTEEDFSKISDIHEAANIAITEFIEGLAASMLVVLKAGSST